MSLTFPVSINNAMSENNAIKIKTKSSNLALWTENPLSVAMVRGDQKGINIFLRFIAQQTRKVLC